MNTLVRTEQGIVDGFAEDGVARFFGIPFAQPPVGDRRWRPPLEPVGWGGARPAWEFGPICPQTSGAVFTPRATSQSEDCLYLNVWTGSTDSEAKQPVMVWIHGGGYLGGSGCEDGTDGASLAAHGVTVVSINYRLGAFGYLADPELGCNFGLLDQIAALRWVQRSIAGFGGDPGNITVFGQSAGGHAVRMLLEAPAARGLFHRAIVQSSAIERFTFDTLPTGERTRLASQSLIRHLGGGSPDDLRRLPTAAVTEASHLFSGTIPKRGRVHTPANLAWMPVPDGEILPAQGGTADLAPVPLLLGTTENEARYFIKPGMLPYNRILLWALTRALAGKQAGAVRRAVRTGSDSMYSRFDRAYTAAVFTETTLTAAERLLASGGDLHAYRFARVSPAAAASDERARHTAELRYLFGTLTPEGYDDADRNVSSWIQEQWVAFARDGAPADPSWPRYDERGLIAIIDETVEQGHIDDDPVVGIMHRNR
ncbi:MULTISPECIES: carboxylesterase/lipase family protein [unclassified Microbacterium]|uniref:carboxylesterase/lipase family protein n=1 Tax=unclassified Microbacterium TaxID=2609290 RepID=UPI0036576587